MKKKVEVGTVYLCDLVTGLRGFRSSLDLEAVDRTESHDGTARSCTLSDLWPVCSPEGLWFFAMIDLLDRKMSNYPMGCRMVERTIDSDGREDDIYSNRCRPRHRLELDECALPHAQQLCQKQGHKPNYWGLGVSATHKIPFVLSWSTRSTVPHKDARWCRQHYLMTKFQSVSRYHPDAIGLNIIYQKTILCDCRRSVDWNLETAAFSQF